MERKDNIYDRQYRNAGLQVCREIFGTDQIEELRQIAKKAEKYDLILQTSHTGNLRGAGRKAKYTEEDIQRIYEMHEAGVSVQKIAQQFKTSRQTIYKYLAARIEQEDMKLTMRVNYMDEYTVCSVIDVDEANRKVRVKNKVRDYSKCAFGALQEPTFDAFEWFLESRCFARDDPDIEKRLKELGLESYDPLRILEQTKGRLETDRHWLQIIRYERDGI